jgi:hypothetical protein
LAEILRDKGDYAHSESLLTRAAAIFDIARLRVGGDLSRATFQWSPYRSLALTRLALGKRDAAWEAAERSLGRVLADVLLTADKRSLTSVETAREDSLEQRLDQLERQLQTFLSAAGSDKTGDTSRRAEEVRTQLLSTQAEWGTFQHELAAQYPVSEGQAYPLDRIQATLSADEAIVSWLDADSLQARAGISSWGYVIRNEGPVRWHELA